MGVARVGIAEVRSLEGRGQRHLDGARRGRLVRGSIHRRCPNDRQLHVIQPCFAASAGPLDHRGRYRALLLAPYLRSIYEHTITLVNQVKDELDRILPIVNQIHGSRRGGYPSNIVPFCVTVACRYTNHARFAGIAT